MAESVGYAGIDWLDHQLEITKSVSPFADEICVAFLAAACSLPILQLFVLIATFFDHSLLLLSGVLLAVWFAVLIGLIVRYKSVKRFLTTGLRTTGVILSLTRSPRNAQVTYSYVVDGTNYTGKKDFSPPGGFDGVPEYIEGGELTVIYDVKSPKRSLPLEVFLLGQRSPGDPKE